MDLLVEKKIDFLVRESRYVLEREYHGKWRRPGNRSDQENSAQGIEFHVHCHFSRSSPSHACSRAMSFMCVTANCFVPAIT